MLKLYTIAEYAKKRKISRIAVWQKIKAKEILAVKVSPKLYLVVK